MGFAHPCEFMCAPRGWASPTHCEFVCYRTQTRRTACRYRGKDWRGRVACVFAKQKYRRFPDTVAPESLVLGGKFPEPAEESSCPKAAQMGEI